MKYKVEYLGHSAFLVELDKYYLFFDYVGNVKMDRYSIEERNINFLDYNDKKIIMFYSHNHFDHYNPNMHGLSQNYSNITSVLGDIASNLKNTITIKNNKKTLKKKQPHPAKGRKDSCFNNYNIQYFDKYVNCLFRRNRSNI